jgi:ADP-heptose:LPS heptosyltransferase
MMPRVARPPHSGRRILIARMDSIGDMILFSACLSAYRDLFRDDHIVLVVRREVYDVVAGCPLVDEAWSLDSDLFRKSFAERWRWCRRIRNGSFDVSINPVFSNHFPEFDCLTWWTGAKQRMAHRCDDRYGRRRRSWPYYTELAASTPGPKFEIDRNFDLLRHLGYCGPVRSTTHVWTDQRERAESLYGRTNGEERPYAVVVPGARSEEKIWGAENYAMVIQAVCREVPLRWLVCGTEGEEQICKSLLDDLIAAGITAENLAGRTSLAGLKSIIEGATLCLGNDSAPAHIAAAVGTPGVCVLGGGHFGRFYPYPGNPLTVAIFNRLPCYHCDWHCVLHERECLTRISLDSVVNAVLSVLARSGQRYRRIPDVVS